MAITKREGGLPHVFWIDLKGNGVLTECAVFKEDGFGNIYYMEIPPLDSIDKTRLVRLLSSRNAKEFELWDTMSSVTLNNGINALDYFHQLVRVITREGVVMNPRSGQVGTGIVNTNAPEEMAAIGIEGSSAEKATKSKK